MDYHTIVIYHGGCDDGFTSAFIARIHLGIDGVEYYPGTYQKEPPDVTGKTVYLVDFSYKRPILAKMLEQCKDMIILDHHKTAKEDLAGLDMYYANLHLEFDMTRSGAGMTWDYFSQEPRPDFVNYVEDRDLWNKLLPGSDEFVIALRSYPQDFDVWTGLFYHVNKLIAEGYAIQRYYRLRVEELKKHSYIAVLGGHYCAISNAPYFAASEVAGELCDVPGVEFGACYFEEAPGVYTYSLRSRDDFDVSKIALQFWGGGHKNAAGFKSDGLSHTATNG